MPFTTPPAVPPVFGDKDMLLYHLVNGNVKLIFQEERNVWATCFPDTYTDKAIQTYVSLSYNTEQWILFARMTDKLNHYVQCLEEAAAGEDHFLRKMVGGTGYIIAIESVDLLRAYYIRSLKLSCSGSTIRGYRGGLEVPRLTVTDTAHTSGYFGLGCKEQHYVRMISHEALMHARITSASSSVRTLRYFEAPLIGSGTDEDPFRADVPKEITTHPEFGDVNLLAFTHSSLIKSGADGKPKEYTAIVRVLEQPDRPAYLRSLASSLDEFRALRGVRELTLEEAKRKAKALDDKLTDEDLKEW